ncbi:MAG: glycosyltransferase family 39 protein [Lachnospiraceae bacterium]|nr:glycosyltransferase family 39 protein [Lachnospiraceae bacterium]
MNSRSGISEKIIYALLAAFTLCMICIHAVRLPFNVFWVDTAFSVDLIRLPIREMLAATAVNEHPPFYYLFGKFVTTILGDRPASFRATGFIPYLGILILAHTYVRKHFGIVPAIIITAFASLTPTSVIYVMETRMYELGCFLMLAAFLSMHQLMCYADERRNGKWILFYFLSMMTAYTHYYLTVAVCILYLSLILFCIVNRKDIARCMICSVLAILSYLPWLGVMLKNFGVRAGDWWAEGFSGFDESMCEIFGLKRFYLPALFFAAVLVCGKVVESRHIRKKTASGDSASLTSGDGREKQSGSEKPAGRAMLWFLITGILVIALVMAVGALVSILVRPLFLSRYVYPLASIGWLLFGMGLGSAGEWLAGMIPEDKKKLSFAAKLAPAVVAFLIAAFALKTFYGVYRDNRDVQRQYSEETAAFLDEVTIPAGSVIYSSIEQEEFTIAGCYFPGTDVYIENALFYYSIPVQDEFYLVWQISAVDVTVQNLDSYGYGCSLIKSGGTLGLQRDVSILFCKKY